MDLDNVSSMTKLDSQNMRGSITELPLQIEQIWQEVQEMTVDMKLFEDIDNIVFVATGGSGLGAHIAQTIFGNALPCSYQVVNDYSLPQYVDEDTLVFLQSYSGNTEEVINALGQAIKKTKQVIVISAGGKLEELAKKHNLIHVKINPIHNPSNQPRMGIGYSVFSCLAMLNKLNLIHVDSSEIRKIIDLLQLNNSVCGIEAPLPSNPAKLFAEKIKGRMPILVAGEFLVGTAHTICNQINENAKSMAIYYPLPEMNHHLLEALREPDEFSQRSLFVCFNSQLYSEKISARLALTKESILGQGYIVEMIEPKGETKRQQTAHLLHFGAYAGYYLAMLYEIDPSPIIQVESFKKKL